jgi:bifunctional N-acetylglucosamine-1-phosphate-uridyltransferase/glucosamine-1-phosphate-acetyltransferase GlmU-like protein
MNGLQHSCVVVLAAGLGSRFGGLKQLAPVGAHGAAIMDVLVERAAVAGFERAVIVVSPEAAAPVHSHLEAMGEKRIPVDLAVQPRQLGTADAVLAARSAVDGSFVVVNGDDLYPAGGFALLADHLREGPADEHAMVAFRAARTLAGKRRVSRALVDVDATSALVGIREGAVVPGTDGLRFEIGASAQPLRDDALVSMNMWAFRPAIFHALADAVGRFVGEQREGEAYLPDVVAAQVSAQAARVRVFVSEDRCLGVTHHDDLAAVRSALS